MLEICGALVLPTPGLPRVRLTFGSARPTSRATFSAAQRGALAVCDNGAAIPKALAERLFDGAVSSNTGLGVGLYQSGRLAAQCGYRLALTANAPGIVCFVLSGEAAGGAAAAGRPGA